MNNWQKFYWSVRRELWEHRAIVWGPLLVAGVVVFGFLYRSFGFAGRFRGWLAMEPEKQVLNVLTPYSLAASVIILVSFIVAAFYSFDALNGERRDRSILFWKSMPVSDLTTVLSKAAVAMVVTPVIAFCIALATQLFMLIASSSILLFNGMSPADLWKLLPIGHMTIVMAYGIAIHAIWFGPALAFFLLMSAWAKTSPFLWVALSVFAAFAVEKMTAGTSFVAAMLNYRIVGAMQEGFTVNAMKSAVSHVSQIDIVRFFTTPNVWIGIVFTVVCLALAVRLRREREPF
jgi:ABC-2 type transport system permease protein